ncbi:hypothetical protein [Streptomyces sp. NPDC017448]|uniref:hypothetical protein n=1 Tax=Streptomyces sp. NPDC017448 TaxID=3364996 RepID=UPI0037AB791C
MTDEHPYTRRQREMVEWFEHALEQRRGFGSDADIDAKLLIIKQWRSWERAARKSRASQAAGLIALTWSQPLAILISTGRGWAGWNPDWDEQFDSWLSDATSAK